MLLRSCSVAALLLASCGSEPGRSPLVPEEPLSIVIVSLDTLRADHVGAYGYERPTTPFLDELAEESILFERAYTTAPWTLIAHASMLTGFYPTEHTVTEGDRAVPPEVPLLAERLRDRGYRTVGLYFDGWMSPRHGFGRGFDVYLPHEDAEEATARLEKLLATMPRDRPLFLFLHLFDVHCTGLGRPGTLYEPPPPYDRMFQEDAPELLASRYTQDDLHVWDLLTEEQVEALVALYDGGVRYVDSVVERWFESFRREGLLDRALVVVTSDHGEALGQRGILGGHGSMWEEGLRVPLLLRLPGGRRGGERVRETVSLVDLVPTALRTAGLDPDPRLPGRSLVGPLPGARTVVAERPPHVWAVQEDTKVRLSPVRGHLFHLDQDPLELSPVRGEAYERAVGRVRAAWVREHEDRPRLEVDPAPAGARTAEETKRLRALGYADEVD